MQLNIYQLIFIPDQLFARTGPGVNSCTEAASIFRALQLLPGSVLSEIFTILSVTRFKVG